MCTPAAWGNSLRGYGAYSITPVSKQLNRQLAHATFVVLWITITDLLIVLESIFLKGVFLLQVSIQLHILMLSTKRAQEA
jgi:hypothetical protein